MDSQGWDYGQGSAKAADSFEGTRPMTGSSKPIVALTFGDASGVGPELAAKLLTRADVIEAATIVLVGNPWVCLGGRQACCQVLARCEADWALGGGARHMAHRNVPRRIKSSSVP